MSTRKRSDLVSLCFYGAVLLLFFYNASAFTDPSDVKAMEDFYGLLNHTTQLTGWTATGGDPCGRNWRGVSCSGSSIASIDISGLGLGGTMSSQLSSLLSLTQLDMSYNNISGEISSDLPPNATLINLAANKFVGNIPMSLPYLKHLKHLNVSSNNLSGILGSVFTDMTSLEKLDLSFNSFSGDLPSSFGSLQNLHSLHLQHNHFTGSVSYLTNLPLTDLNIENNNFSGYVPKHFEVIPELRMEGNQFQPYFLNRTRIFFPPLPSADKNVSHTPIVTHEVLHQHRHKKSNVAVALMAAAFSTIFVSFAISLAVYLLIRRARNEEEIVTIIMSSPSIMSPPAGSIHNSMTSMHSPFLQEINTRRCHNIRGRISFSNRARKLPLSRQYFASDLSVATNDYSRGALIGAGPIGSAFKAMFPDGQVLALKRIEVVNMELLEVEQEEFLDLVSTMSDLKHPNLCVLQGYCIDPGHHALLYDFARNGSLHSALFSKDGDSQKPLSWKVRLRIALGVAHALEYMHEICSPPFAHGNIKARNVLLDEEFVPHVTDFGLTMLSSILPTTNVDFKMFEGSKGYTAPEMSRPSSDKIKGDIFSFGVLLLELLTGLKAFDSSGTGEEEQYLVQYASPHLHDLGSLQRIVDPTISETIPSHSLSCLADIIVLCIQPLPQFRIPMSEVAEKLVKLVQKVGRQHNCQGVSSQSEPPMVDIDYGHSFRTTLSHFDPSSSPSTARATSVGLVSNVCEVK
ncbi:Protein STRUBBELIG-RECEPTOR FAMILY 8 [Rhynchospora pubera]|uniref:Protein STRUBBELIG-RECEPTOR FAMILY 8 n=1 Tax=Rhynchospora pubera TaxID=906938 RepID=A0AAV8CQT3_9POAL|nr:Protein STRUBBELIG-RECEPTOR FAMILY 8 [Rhynchospora pubera]